MIIIQCVLKTMVYLRGRWSQTLYEKRIIDKINDLEQWVCRFYSIIVCKTLIF